MNSQSKLILFVGTDSGCDFEDIARMNPGWEVTPAATGMEAAACLDHRTFDAVVVDEQLGDMPGTQLLDSVQQRHPKTQCFILHDLADPSAAVESVRSPHQAVPKPVDPDVLRDMLERAFSRRLWLSNPKVGALLQGMKVVPSPPDLYFAVVRALNSPDLDMDEITRRTAQDPAMTAKLLRVANSAALGLRHEVANVGEAISYLGLETIRSLVLLAHTFSYCDHSRASGFNIDRLWMHSLATGMLARRIAREEPASPKIVDGAFLAGILHDIGELLLATNLSREYGEVVAEARRQRVSGAPVPLCQIEAEMIGATHAEIGAELMALWNLPMPVIEAIALHHQPAQVVTGGFSPLTAVHVADALAEELSGGPEPRDYTVIDLDYLEHLGLGPRLEPWREACQQEIAAC